MEDRARLRELFQHCREILAEKEREQLGTICEHFQESMDALKHDYETMEQEVIEVKQVKKARQLNSQREGRDWHQESNLEGPMDELKAVQKVKTRDYIAEYTQKYVPIFKDTTEISEFLNKKRPNPFRFPLGKSNHYESFGRSASKSSRRESRRAMAQSQTFSLPRKGYSLEKTDSSKHLYYMVNPAHGLK